MALMAQLFQFSYCDNLVVLEFHDVQTTKWQWSVLSSLACCGLCQNPAMCPVLISLLQLFSLQLPPCTLGLWVCLLLRVMAIFLLLASVSILCYSDYVTCINCESSAVPKECHCAPYDWEHKFWKLFHFEEGQSSWPKHSQSLLFVRLVPRESSFDVQEPTENLPLLSISFHFKGYSLK